MDSEHLKCLKMTRQTKQGHTRIVCKKNALLIRSSEKLVWRQSENGDFQIGIANNYSSKPGLELLYTNISEW